MKKIMTTWTMQMGHPLVEVHIVNETTIVLTQNHFFLDSSTIISVLGVHKSLE